MLTAYACIGCGANDDSPAEFESSNQDGGTEESSSFGESTPSRNDASVDTIPFGGDPKDCTEAASFKTYLGCDFWPTITPNFVWNSFDYTVVVTNYSDTPADVHVTGPLGTDRTVRVAANSLEKIFLPWVAELKDPASAGESQVKLTKSIAVKKGAYHLTSSVPVAVFQFNPLEYISQGGASGKTWTCRSSTFPCLSYSNDATLLLPSTALTGNYRVTGFDLGGNLTLTGTEDNTLVKIRVGDEANKVQAGTGITETPAKGTLSLTLNAGDVVTLASWGSMGGSLVSANKPVQAIASNVCSWTTNGACDHMEETILPAETLGKRYVIAKPTAPTGKPVGQLVYFYGNVDGTKLTYAPKKPDGCPSTLNAGQIARCDLTGSGVGIPYTPNGYFGTDARNLVVNDDFEVSGDHEFAVTTFMQGALAVDPATHRGDPSQSSAVSVEQFRDNYTFLSPNDYDVTFVDVIAAPGTSLTLDGSPIAEGATPISSAYGVVRIELPAKEAHTIRGDKPFGAQVIGYGDATSYQYPAGLNLGRIAPPPPPVN